MQNSSHIAGNIVQLVNACLTSVILCNLNTWEVKEEDQVFKVILDYSISLRRARVIV